MTDHTDRLEAAITAYAETAVDAYRAMRAESDAAGDRPWNADESRAAHIEAMKKCVRRDAMGAAAKAYTETGGDPGDGLLARLRDPDLILGSMASGKIEALPGDTRLREAADRIEALTAERDGLLHDLNRQMDIAASECDRAERYRVALSNMVEDGDKTDREQALRLLSETPEQTEGSDGSLRSLSRDTEAE